MSVAISREPPGLKTPELYWGHRQALKLVRPLGMAAAAAAAAILISYAVGFRPGYRPWPTAPGTSPVTAVTLLLLGIGLSRHRLWHAARWESLWVSAALAIALLRMAEITFAFTILPWTTIQPGPHAPPISFGWNSAFGAALCAITILSMHHMRPAVSQLLASLSIAVPTVALVGYSYGLTVFHGQSSLYTALILAVLGNSVALACARSGVVHILLSPFVAGRLARIQLIGAFFIPYLTGAALLHVGDATHARTVIGFGVVFTALFMEYLFSISLLALDRMDRGRRRAERAAYHDATHDHLTGLPNRRMFVDIAKMDLRRAQRQGNPACLIMLDIDHFKAINDQFGHAAGDQVLQQTAKIIAQTIRAGDLAARIGGEEFAIFLPNTPAHDGLALAERLQRSLAAADFSGSLAMGRQVTLSAGVAVRAADYHGLSAMLTAADSALYAAKTGGRNRIELAW